MYEVEPVLEVKKSNDGLDVVLWIGLIMAIGAATWFGNVNSQFANLSMAVGFIGVLVLGVLTRTLYQKKRPIAILSTWGVTCRSETPMPWSVISRDMDKSGVVMLRSASSRDFRLEISEASLGYDGFLDAVRFLHNHSPVAVDEFIPRSTIAPNKHIR